MSPEPQVIDELVQLGRSGEERVPPSLADEAVAWRTVVCGNELWRQAAQERTSEDVADLIRGLILYCRASGRRIGGSVSPVIVLYRILADRAPSWEPNFTSWILAHRTNPYEPFGSVNDEGATTHAEYVERHQTRVLGGRANVAAELERQEEARKLRAVDERNEATQRLAAAVRRGDLPAVQALLAKGADVKRSLPGGDSLVTLAENNGRNSVAEFLKSLGVV